MWQARVEESTVLNDAGRLDAGTDDEWGGARQRYANGIHRRVQVTTVR
jgi:hypothetical protein